MSDGAKQDFAMCAWKCAAYMCVNEVQVWWDNQGKWVIGDSCVIGAMVDGNASPCGTLWAPETEQPLERTPWAPETERPLERTLWAPETERPLERTLWAPGSERPLRGTERAPERAPGTERTLEWTLRAPGTERPLERTLRAPGTEQPLGAPRTERTMLRTWGCQLLAPAGVVTILAGDSGLAGTTKTDPGLAGTMRADPGLAGMLWDSRNWWCVVASAILCVPSGASTILVKDVVSHSSSVTPTVNEEPAYNKA